MSKFSNVVGYVVDKYRGGSRNVAIHQVKSGAKPETSMSCIGPGIEINPANGENLVITQIGNSNSFVVSIGGVNQNIAPNTARGERRIYSVSEDGETIKAIAKFKNDGVLELNGATDSAVKFSGLQTAYDELKGKYNDLISRFTAWVPAPGDGGTALKVLLTAPPVLTSAGDITASESADVKLS